MIRSHIITRLAILFLFAMGCTIQFIPEIDENKELLVVEGMITDQDRTNTVILSRSLPLGKPLVRKPVKGAIVTIIDDQGVISTLKEKLPGIYITDSTQFRGYVGSRYSLNITIVTTTYSTGFIELKPVPPISTLDYEKVVITASDEINDVKEGCRIYVDSNDPSGECLWFRWEYVETYEYHVPYDVINNVCWVTERSDRILIKNTSVYNQARVTDFPILFLTSKTDKLKERYSILVKQYSLNAEEYDFWERVQSISQNVGGLYDITPMAIQSNISCNSNPAETVLGYFSVSAVTEKRLFIDDTFLGLPDFYSFCIADTLVGELPEAGLNVDFWVIEDNANEIPPFWVVSTRRECADCTTRGTTVRPDFWNEF